jgi:uncharacterized membrane protein
MDKGRTEAFSDGVFAVAITVLVFNLLPIGDGRGLSYAELGRAWPQYAAYAVGFLTIGIIWLNHHTMLAHAARIDRTTLVLNILLLMVVVILPWPTALVADHLRGPGPAARVAAVIYGIASILMGLAFSLLWAYLSLHQESLVTLPAATRRRAGLRFGAGLAGYIAGTLIAAFVSAGVAVIIYALVGIYYVFEQLPVPSAPAVADEPPGR